MTAEFRPPAWLGNPHVQSIFPSLPFRRPGVERRCRSLLAASRDEILDCGEGVRLLAKRATQQSRNRPAASRVVVLLHGWEGSSESLYILSLGQALWERGFEVVRLNLRDHGDSHHLNPEIFHSCRIREVVGAVQRLQQLEPAQAVNLVGFSLGGNFCLRVGARAAEAGLRLEQVVAVCPVIDPEHTLVRLERGWALYRQYFVWKWRRSLRRKQAAWPQLYDLSEALELDNLTDMTDHLVCKYGGYPSLGEYLHGYAIVDDALASLVHPTRIISSADDPIIPASDLSRIAQPHALSITCTTLGGHCGFYDGQGELTWIEREVLATLSRRQQ
ncbi:MAG: Alpha/beta fold hydrolase [Pseudomonadota bacterium]|nr:Alpha/beta fold hydrolase [Pseudomonadota bacterium]MDQ1310828.1 Alpha/beta fold hydrolase [Pseudomonadota bacterium]